MKNKNNNKKGKQYLRRLPNYCILGCFLTSSSKSELSSGPSRGDLNTLSVLNLIRLTLFSAKSHSGDFDNYPRKRKRHGVFQDGLFFLNALTVLTLRTVKFVLLIQSKQEQKTHLRFQVYCNMESASTAKPVPRLNI